MNTKSSLAGIGLVALITLASVYGMMKGLEETDKVRPEISFDSKYKVDNTLVIEMTNTGEPVNTSKLKVYYRFNHETYNYTELPGTLKQEKACLPENTTWRRNQRIKCRTGIKFPSTGQKLEVILRYGDKDYWKAECEPSTSSAVGC